MTNAFSLTDRLESAFSGTTEDNTRKTLDKSLKHLGFYEIDISKRLAKQSPPSLLDDRPLVISDTHLYSNGEGEYFVYNPARIKDQTADIRAMCAYACFPEENEHSTNLMIEAIERDITKYRWHTGSKSIGRLYGFIGGVVGMAVVAGIAIPRDSFGFICDFVSMCIAGGAIMGGIVGGASYAITKGIGQVRLRTQGTKEERKFYFGTDGPRFMRDNEALSQIYKKYGDSALIRSL